MTCNSFLSFQFRLFTYVTGRGVQQRGVLRVRLLELLFRAEEQPVLFRRVIE